MNTPRHICQVAFSALDNFGLRKWYCDAFQLLESSRILFFPPSTTQVQGIKNALSTCGWLVDSQDYFQLEFFKFINPRSKPRPDRKPSDIGYNILGIQVADFDKTVKRLNAMGSAPITDPRGDKGNRRVCVADPEGNIVELFESYPVSFPDVVASRPEINSTVRSIVVSVPDLEKSRNYFSEVLGLSVVEDGVLHDESHEEMWGLPGARSKRLLLRSANFLVELVQYIEPSPRAWPEGYQICDQGIMNIALGYSSTADFDQAFKKAVDGGSRPNGKPVDIGVFKVMYVNDDDGFSVEMLHARRRLWSVSGFNPSYAYVTNEVMIDASPEEVWSVLTDHDTMGDWCLFKAKVVRPGDTDPKGLGTQRKVSALGMKILEEIIEWEPHRRFAYTVRSGGGVKDYRGDLLLSPQDDGTHLRWSMRFRPLIPGGGKPAALLLKKIFASAVQQLKAKVEAAKAV
ncbi:SRPBCC family protein [Desulforhopalus singaporensis]|uniref:Catechol 2,3-dioxygenase n=1 Tax=Desulforhopalus singaporensis TaxID=91360 RepID=A0A1H0V7I4_9BACT|nr:SRPBCC family protein [Desulforhopalus singaporensis]SDP74367.1 Catechol 2,3-dioxygenase [Desulforhopalus singaporensis]